MSRSLNRWLIAATLALTACLPLAQSVPAGAAVSAGNPVIPGDRPDPDIELFNGAYYIYTTSSGGTTDAPGQDFYAWKSYDMRTWFNAGVVLDSHTVGWANGDGRNWAPQMVARNGKYYLYSAIADNVAVATCTSPVGPCTDKGSPLINGALYQGVEAIDPMAFIDTDGQAYLYFGGSAGGGNLGIFKLNTDMVSLNGAVTVQRPTNYTEASEVFKRNGKYYLQYSNGAYNNNTYNVEYSTSSSPMGPWTFGGKILSATGPYNGPGHDAVLNYPGTDDWYMVYHRYLNGNYSVRNVAIDRMYFNGDGSIQPITLTDSGVPARLAPGAPSPLPAVPAQNIVTPGSKCLDVYGDDNGGNNAAVQIWDCLGGAADQHWTWNGSSLRTLGRCLDLANAGTVNGTLLQLYDCNGAPGQQWQQRDDGSMVNPATGRCLDTPNGVTTNGTRVELYDCLGNTAQKFALGYNTSSAGTGATTIAGPGGKCVDVAGDDNGVNLAAIQLWDCLPSAVDQHWTWNGTSLTTLGRCLDINGNGTANFTPVELYDCNGVGGQQWVQQANGSLLNPQSGRCLDDPNGNTANGTRLQIYDCNNNAAQVFVKS